MYDNGKIVKYTEAIKYRFEKKDENGEINNLYFSNDWEDIYKTKNKPTTIPVYYEGCDYDKSVMYINGFFFAGFVINFIGQNFQLQHFL